MTNKTQLKFVPVPVNPQPCSDALADEHLMAFANSFIAKNHVPRWIYCTIKKPDKARHELVKFCKYLDKNHCHLITGSALFPLSLAEKYGNALGVYFDGRNPPVLLTIAEAGMFQVDAIFSMKAGKLAIFFFHEGWAWHCEKFS